MTLLWTKLTRLNPLIKEGRCNRSPYIIKRFFKISSSISMSNHIISKILLWLTRKIFSNIHTWRSRNFILRHFLILPSCIYICPYLYIKSLIALGYLQTKGIIIKYICSTFRLRDIILSFINPSQFSTRLRDYLI